MCLPTFFTFYSVVFCTITAFDYVKQADTIGDINFHVQANRDVTRMEIFMSLVRLLEQTLKGSTSSPNAMENNNMMIHHGFPQSTPITATGRLGSLQ